LLPGWIGLNAAGAVLLYRVDPTGIPLLAVNTLLSAAGSVLAAVVLTRVRFGKPDASLTANGWIGGLVAGSAACPWVTPLVAAFIGAIAGILIVLTVEWLELRLRIDDPAGAISVHGVAGVWGLLAVGTFARGTRPGQMLAQAFCVATLLGFVLPMTYLLNWCATHVYRYRVDRAGERQGLDLHELGGGAYPEFVLHPDDVNHP